MTTTTKNARNEGTGRRAAVAGAGALGAALVLGAAGIAGAAAPTGAGSNGSRLQHLLQELGGKPAALGKVTSVGTDTFAITTLRGAADTVDVSSSTTYWSPKTSTVGFGDVKTGDYVAVVGTASGATIQATRVDIVTAQQIKRFVHRHGAVVGTVASVGSDGFTVTPLTGGAAVTVDVTSSTTYREPGQSGASFASVKVGEKVAVLGPRASGAVDAKAVVIGPKGGQGLGQGQGLGHPGAFGTVASVGDNTFSVTPLRGGAAVTVDVSASTKYREPGTANPSFADVSVGEHVAVFGQQSGAAFQAQGVMILPAGFGHGGGAGGPAA